MKRKGNIADFFIKRPKSGPDQAQADPSPESQKSQYSQDQAQVDRSPESSSSQPGASQGRQYEDRQGPSLPPPGQNIQRQ